MEKSSFFNSVNGDRKYKSSDFAEYFASFIGNGVFPVPASGLQIVSNNNMTVTLKQGKAWINGYFYTNTDDVIIKIDNADGVLSRIDRIVIKLDYINRVVKAVVKKGTFSDRPVVQNLQRDSDAYEIALGDISIQAGAISILQSNITDLRFNKDLCGLAHGTVDQIDSTVIFNQFQSWYTQKQNEYNTNVAGWTTTKQGEFNAWVSGKQTDYNTWTDAKKKAFDDWFTANTLAFSSQFNTWYGANTSTWNNTFNSWFDKIKNTLNGDTGGSLALQVSGIKDDVGKLKDSYNKDFKFENILPLQVTRNSVEVNPINAYNYKGNYTAQPNKIIKVDGSIIIDYNADLQITEGNYITFTTTKDKVKGTLATKKVKNSCVVIQTPFVDLDNPSNQSTIVKVSGVITINRTVSNQTFFSSSVSLPLPLTYDSLINVNATVLQATSVGGENIYPGRFNAAIDNIYGLQPNSTSVVVEAFLIGQIADSFESNIASVTVLWNIEFVGPYIGP